MLEAELERFSSLLIREGYEGGGFVVSGFFAFAFEDEEKRLVYILLERSCSSMDCRWI